MTTGPRLKKAKNEPVILQGSTLARIEATDPGTADGERNESSGLRSGELWLVSRPAFFFKEIGFSEHQWASP